MSTTGRGKEPGGTGPGTPWGKAGNWLVGSFAVATAVLTFAGASGGNLTRIIRIHPWPFGISLSLLVLAIVFGVVAAVYDKTPQHLLIWLGLAGFVGGIVLMLVINAQTTRAQERPLVIAQLNAQKDSPVLKAGVKAAGLEVQDYVYVVVEGENARTKFDSNSAKLTTDSPPPGKNGIWTQQLYIARVGPNPAGIVDLSFEVPITIHIYDAVRVVAQVVNPNSRAPEGTTDKSGNFICGPTSKPVGCADVLLPATLDAASTR